jgi:hypothetical protein
MLFEVQQSNNIRRGLRGIAMRVPVRATRNTAEVMGVLLLIVAAWAVWWPLALAFTGIALLAAAEWWSP